MNNKDDKYSLFGGAKIQKMALCVKEKGITIYGRFGLAGCARACEGCQGGGGCGLQDLGVCQGLGKIRINRQTGGGFRGGEQKESGIATD